MQRRILVHLPPHYDGVTPLPVVLNFHGGMSTPEQQSLLTVMDWTADENGFIVVYPEGSGTFGLYTWNADTCCGYAQTHRIDDVAYTEHLITQALPSLYRIDSSRIYVTGISNGGMLAYKLGAELSHLIAAIAPVAGDMGVLADAEYPVPVMHFHGLQDQHVPFYGGVGPAQVYPYYHRPIPETIDWWVGENGLSSEPVLTETATDYIRYRYEGPTGAPVELYALPDGGHTWPGGTEPAAIWNLGNVVESVEATELMWDFLKNYRREP